ncbi:MAG: Phosphate acyltransferase [Actinomycetota bacterium]|nr:Phosphate acyltransferase [Actinomycetota bacterium]
MATVALDLLGGDGAPGVVADAIARLCGPESSQPGSPDPADLIVVGPAAVARELLVERGVDPDRVRIVDAGRGASMAGNPLSMLRAHDDVTVTVAVGLVNAGLADAWVSVGHTGAAVAAAVLGLGRLSGMSRPALAVVLPSLAGPVVLVDAGAAPDATPDVLRQFALAGWAYSRSLGVASPKVGLISIGSEDGKGDRLRKSTHDLLAESLPAVGVDYVGAVEGHDVAIGSQAQVFVTDGFTGNVLLKGIEGAVRWAAYRMGEAYGDAEPARGVVRSTGTGDFAGGMLLGVNGVTVIGHGAGTADEICACVRLADRAARTGLVTATQQALSSLTAR